MATAVCRIGAIGGVYVDGDIAAVCSYPAPL